MTVEQWLLSRSPVAPEPLLQRLLEVLGDGARAPEAQASRVFLESARSLLGALLGESRFEREGALDLLVADALMTYAFEHAAQAGTSHESLQALAYSSSSTVGRLASEHA